MAQASQTIANIVSPTKYMLANCHNSINLIFVETVIVVWAFAMRWLYASARERYRFTQSYIISRIILLFACFGLTGCVGFIDAELNNRGGYLDQKLDSRWMIADTKQMRVLRAYVMIGSVARMAQTKYPAERELIVQHINTAIKVMSDAYYCAYSQPGRCIYFDERMAEAEIAVLRLLVAVLSKQEDEEILTALNEQLSESIPILKSVNSISSLVDAISSSGELIAETPKLIKSFINTGQWAYIKGRRIGALYRDSIELQMITTISSLDAMCAIQNADYVNYVSPDQNARLTKLERYQTRKITTAEEWAIDNFYGHPTWPDACPAWRKGHQLWQRGSGDLAAWSDYLFDDAAQFRTWIMPNENAFMQASDLIWRACESITSDPNQLSDCIGRRKVRNADGGVVAEKECAVDFDRQPSEARRVAREISEEQTAFSPWHDQCRLILYAKVVGLRGQLAGVGNLRGNSDARLYWLSELTPSPAHPLENRNGY